MKVDFDKNQEIQNLFFLKLENVFPVESVKFDFITLSELLNAKRRKKLMFLKFPICILICNGYTDQFSSKLEVKRLFSLEFECILRVIINYNEIWKNKSYFRSNLKTHFKLECRDPFFWSLENCPIYNRV